jgi:hypothetical protein
MESHHEYRITAFGAGARNGVVQAEGVLSSISFSAPPEFLGEPGARLISGSHAALRFSQ